MNTEEDKATEGVTSNVVDFAEAEAAEPDAPDCKRRKFSTDEGKGISPRSEQVTLSEVFFNDFDDPNIEVISRAEDILNITEMPSLPPIIMSRRTVVFAEDPIAIPDSMPVTSTPIVERNNYTPLQFLMIPVSPMNLEPQEGAALQDTLEQDTTITTVDTSLNTTEEYSMSVDSQCDFSLSNIEPNAESSSYQFSVESLISIERRASVEYQSILFESVAPEAPEMMPRLEFEQAIEEFRDTTTTNMWQKNFTLQDNYTPTYEEESIAIENAAIAAAAAADDEINPPSPNGSGMEDI